MADSVPDPPKEETAAPAAAGQESSAQLADLIARAGRSYAAKDYNGASELYSQATELQARLNGEMTPQNAELLYLYGRCLYHVGAGKSEVLGGQDADMEVTDGAEKRREPVGSTAAAPTGAPPTTVRRKMMDEALSEVMEHKDRAAEEKAPPKKPANNALFQITGDENWDVSDEDEDADADGEGVDGEAGGDAEDDDDDDDELTVAWETLDLARVLYNRQLEELQEEGAAAAEAGKEQGDASARIRTVKERLADIHDLLAEISLGHEGYDAAVADSKSSLSLKKELYPPESSVVAEAHFKLSLALEFASIKAAPDQAGGAADPDSMQVDRAVREEAAQQMEAAIQSARLRVAEEERELETGAEAEAEAENERLKKSINEVKEMIAEMEERLNVLKTNTLSDQRAARLSQTGAAAGLVDSLLAGSAEERKAKIEEAMKGAMDLSSLVRHKKPDGQKEEEQARTKANGASEAAINSNGKRAAEQAVGEDDGGESKRARVETGAAPGVAPGRG